MTLILGSAQQHSPRISGLRLTQRSGSWHSPMLCRVPTARCVSASTIPPNSVTTTSQGVAALQQAMSGGSRLVPRQGHLRGTPQQESGRFACAGTRPSVSRRHVDSSTFAWSERHKSQHCPLTRRFAPYRRGPSDKGKRPFRKGSPTSRQGQ